MKLETCDAKEVQPVWEVWEVWEVCRVWKIWGGREESSRSGSFGRNGGARGSGLSEGLGEGWGDSPVSEVGGVVQACKVWPGPQHTQDKEKSINFLGQKHVQDYSVK